MSTLIPPLPGTTRDPLYPDTDGSPMGESELHFLAIKYLYGALSHWFRSREDVHVAANMLLYYEEGVPSKNRGPDLMVSKGVRGKHRRRSFRIWEEGVVPAVIFEITSIRTQREDEVVKPHVYASIGVREYFMFDPEGGYLRPQLQGFRLENQEYEPMPANDAGEIYSPELGLRLIIDDDLPRLVDPAAGKPLPTEEEYVEQLEAERRRAAALEAEISRLRASLPPPDGSQ